ncbi:citryl-CoA lyase [Aquabacterium sp. A7-Y]|uniref:citryl-CoA lyase n=1 Tax=Aquabacterium sp. A7-Y TaxID=1349605 RepID=UPI00223DA271|nr:citryl-CoA lyase [Aquabacterium sp. A7-Y]MCW7541944.1 citryl-CoA lyase [Aquabacterium sp. A7-Y]
MAVTTEIGTTTPDVISVRGSNLATEILGRFDFVDMICWLCWSRLPQPREKNMINLLLVAAADHGLTPSAISSRLTFLGAPESLQGAVAAGLLGAGSHFLGTVQNVMELLTQGAAALSEDASENEVLACAREQVQAFRGARRGLPGIGHPIHVHGDPRVPALRAASQTNGYFGKHWRLALALCEVLHIEHGKDLPLNAAGAIGAILADMGLDPLFGRGLALIGRAAGLVAHVAEERDHPTGQDLWNLVLAQDPRNVLPPAPQRAERSSAAT